MGATPNDPKLSDRRSGRGTCRWVARRWWSAAGAVTAEPVRCSAWLGVAVKIEKTLISEFGCWNTRLRKASGKDLVVDVVADDDEMRVFRRVVRPLRIMALAIRDVLSLHFGVWNAQDIGMMRVVECPVGVELAAKATNGDSMRERKAANVVCGLTGSLPAAEED